MLTRLTVLLFSLCAACSRSPSRGAVDAGAASTTSAVTSDAADERDPERERVRRNTLVRAIEQRGYVKDERVLQAMRGVPRHLFVPDALRADAYDDRPLPIGEGQTISQPSLVGQMTEQLELAGSERVLEIGTGSGYQAAILARLAREVYTIELLPELATRAGKRLRELGAGNVVVRAGDGYAGWPEKAPFDRVIVTAAPPEVPKALLDQLAEGGILVAPVGEQGATQWLVKVRKKDGQLTREKLTPVRFVPMVRGRE
jgi:protein-L-isoaspartate(D-aspartate) O-methyltransferase